MEQNNTNRIIIIDDNKSIHKQITRILSPGDNKQDKTEALNDLHSAVFGSNASYKKPAKTYISDSAYQGEQGFEMVKEAIEEDKPYAMAIVDMRMPPGWDGLKTIEHIWSMAPKTQILICTAYSDYSLQEINDRLNHSTSYLLLRKPFEVIELEQLAAYMTSKWDLICEKENDKPQADKSKKSIA